MRVPARVGCLCVLLVAAGAAAIWLGWDAYETTEEAGHVWLVDNWGVYLTIGCGIASILSAIAVLGRIRFSGPACLAALGVALAAVIDRAPDPFYWRFIEIILERDPHAPLWPLLDFLLGQKTVWFYFAVCLGLSYVAWLAVARSPDWFKATPSGLPTGRARDSWLNVLGTCLLAALAWHLIRTYGLFSMAGAPLYLNYDIELPFGSWDSALAFLAAFAIVVVRLNERVDVDEEGVRISLAQTGWSLFRLPWKRIRRVEIVRHPKSASTAVLKGFPFSFSVHARRYRDGENVVDQIRNESKRRKILTAEWLVIDTAPWLAATMVAWGAMLIVYVQQAQFVDWAEFLKTNYPPADFDSIASPVRYGLLTALSTACFGTALGLLSAFHCAGVRPFLLALFVIACGAMLPGSIMHWLVWIAIFAIYMAIPFQDPTSTVPSPSMSEWNLGMGLEDYAPLIGAGFYLLAVVLASKRLRS